jgi:hypothetical protein
MAMGTKALPTSTIRATSQQRSSIRRQLERENEYRRQVGLDTFDLEDELRREIIALEYSIFHDRLRPIIEVLFDEFPGSPGIAGRIKGHQELYDTAIRTLRDETGTVPPYAMGFDMVKFLELYQQGELDCWGGAYSLLD